MIRKSHIYNFYWRTRFFLSYNSLSSENCVSQKFSDWLYSSYSSNIVTSISNMCFRHRFGVSKINSRKLIILFRIRDKRKENITNRHVCKSRNLICISNKTFLNPVSATVDKCPGENFLMILLNRSKLRSSLSHRSSILQLFNNMFKQFY